ncbi:MAG: PsiF family protein [Alphaproteobacteria bacterium]|jgi:hypothetical protein|nr:PsiF family protein [Alphaproteobacteria bacterium]
MRAFLAVMLLAMPAIAQQDRPPTDAQARQQERMRQCNADARQNNLAGEARQRFMSACLAGRPTGN